VTERVLGLVLVGVGAFLLILVVNRALTGRWL